MMDDNNPIVDNHKATEWFNRHSILRMEVTVETIVTYYCNLQTVNSETCLLEFLVLFFFSFKN